MKGSRRGYVGPVSSPGPEPATRLRFPWWLLACALIAWLPGVLRGGWALDDRVLLFGNPVTDGSVSWTAAFARDYFHHLGDVGQWRPLSSLSLRLSRGLWGEWVTGYHLENLLLHLAVVALALQTIRELGGRRSWFLGVLVTFAIHPVLADSVIWISGRTSMLGALFPLAGGVGLLVANRRGARPGVAAAIAGLGFLGGMLAKEEAIVFALVLVLLAGTRSRALWRATGAAVVATLVLWWLARGFALGDPFAGATTPVLPDAGLGERLVAGGCALLEAVRLGVLPIDHPPQYRLDFLLGRSAPLSPTLAAVLGWALWLTVLGISTIGFRRTASPVAAASAIAALAFVPFLQLLPIGEVFAPRFLYLPLLFAAPLVGVTLERCLPRPGPFAVAMLLVVVAGGLSFVRGGVYASRAAWRAEVLDHSPDDVPSWNDLGLIREESGDLEGARDAWRRAILLDPDYSRSWSNLGGAPLAGGVRDAAEASWRQALRAGPRNPIVHVNLASLLCRTDRRDEAIPLYLRATELAPGLGPAWRGLGQAYLEQGQPDEARRTLLRALELDPGDRSARVLLERLEGREAPEQP